MGGYYLIVLEGIGWKVGEWILLAKERNQRQLLLTCGFMKFLNMFLLLS